MVRQILDQAMQLPVEDRRQLAEELLAELEHERPPAAASTAKGPYSDWLDAAGSVHSDFRDISTDKYPHVAAAAEDDQPET